MTQLSGTPLHLLDIPRPGPAIGKLAACMASCRSPASGRSSICCCHSCVVPRRRAGLRPALGSFLAFAAIRGFLTPPAVHIFLARAAPGGFLTRLGHAPLLRRLPGLGYLDPALGLFDERSARWACSNRGGRLGRVGQVLILGGIVPGRQDLHQPEAVRLQVDENAVERVDRDFPRVVKLKNPLPGFGEAFQRAVCELGWRKPRLASPDATSTGQTLTPRSFR